MLQNWFIILKWLLILGAATTALVAIQYIVDLIRGKKWGLRCPQCGGSKFEPVNLNDEIKDRKPTRKYQPVSFHIDYLKNISVEPLMRDTTIWPYKTGLICQKCGHRVKTYSGDCNPNIEQRTKCPKCNSSNYSRNISRKSNISGLQTEGLRVWGLWTETCPDCGYSETHKFFYEFSSYEIPDKPNPLNRQSSAPSFSPASDRGSQKWKPKRFRITFNGKSYNLTQRSMYSEIDYIDSEGNEWEKWGSDFRPHH